MPDPVSPELTVEESLREAAKLLDDGMFEAADAILQASWMAHPNNPKLISLFSRLMKETGRQHVAEKLDELSKFEQGEGAQAGEVVSTESGAGRGAKAQALNLFDTAYSLIDIRYFPLAVMLLERCNKLEPDDPTVRYELGFALMALGRVADAVPHFLHAYHEGQDFDTTLNLAVCYMLLRDLPQAKKYTDSLTDLAKEPEESKEAIHRRVALKRMEELATKKSLSRQDWLYTLYGGMILSGKKQEGAKEDPKNIAEVLLLLKGVLEGLRHEPELIEYYNTQSRPLAKICSELMELPMDSYRGPHRPERCLLIMDWATDLIGPHEVFIDNKENRTIFAYAMSQTEPLPLVPDIIGCFAEDPIMPWDSKTRDETFQSIGIKILDKARDLETDPDIIKCTQDLLNYYEAKRSNLVLGNSQTFPERPEYSAEIQGD